MKQFVKNDEGFICVHCGHLVKPLEYSSRDHCPNCLVSLHVDNTPGDRQNKCYGKMMPISIEIHSKKGYIINYRCTKCNEEYKNKAAADDNIQTILKVMKESCDNTIK